MPLLELYGKKPDGAIDKRVIAGMTGWIIFFPTDAPPDGTLVCNGAELSIAAYPELYDAIGTKYGGNGTTKFRLPDMEDRFPRFAGGGHPRMQRRRGLPHGVCGALRCARD